MSKGPSLSDNTPSADPASGSALRRLAAVVVATVITGAVWLVGRAAGVAYLAETPFGVNEVTLVRTAVATTLAGLLGWAVVVGLERVTTSAARQIWVWLGITALAGSLVPVFAAPGEAATQAMLVCLHCVAGAVLIPGLLPARRVGAG